MSNYNCLTMMILRRYHANYGELTSLINRRNTDEMRIVVLNIWEDLYNLSPTLFLPEQTGPFCQRGKCLEGKMSCGIPIPRSATPTDIILKDYPGLTGGENA